MKPSKKFITNRLVAYHSEVYSYRGSEEKYYLQALIDLVNEAYEAGYLAATIDLGEGEL